MDVSPKTLREVEFREKMRGYHPEDVDQFLERVAAGIEVLQDRLRQAIERAQRAEQAANEAGGNDDALRRTLLLAQRTADLAVQEGREQAARIVAAAEQQAQTMAAEAEQRVKALVEEAEQRSQSMVSDAEHQARRGHEDTLVEVRAELAKLEVTRQRLQLDIDAMTRWIGDHRTQLRTALEEALTRVDQIRTNPAPATAGLFAPAAPAAPSAPEPPSTSPAAPGTSPPAGDTAAPSDWAPQVASFAPPPAINPPAPPSPAAPVASAPRQEPIAWHAPDTSGDGTEESGDSDPYFAELRRAISDRDPLLEPADGDPQTATGSGGYTEA